VGNVLAAESAAELQLAARYEEMARRVDENVAELRAFLIEQHAIGARVVAYGAPSRAATLLNAAAIGPELLEFTVDRSAAKHGRRIPGTAIPISDPDRLVQARPDVVLILAWPFGAEIVAALAPLRARGTRFVVPFPRLTAI
jgi:hypothetical protein